MTQKLNMHQKLTILRELLPTSGDQTTFDTCLWSVVIKDARLKDAIRDVRFFGQHVGIFDDRSKAEKLQHLDAIIEAMEQRRASAKKGWATRRFRALVSTPTPPPVSTKKRVLV